VPYELVTDYIRRTSNPLQVCLMSDCDISNPDKAAEAFSHATREPDELAIFRIGNSGQTFVEQMRAAGAAIHDIVQMNDLAGIVLGAVRQRYNRRKQQ
jgi:hypothetical protein